MSMDPFKVFEEGSIPEVESTIRAEFPAAETADAFVVVESEPAFIYCDGVWRTSVHTDPAQLALIRYGTGA